MIALSHPLFREVVACAFDQHERWALDAVLGRPISGSLGRALLSSATNGWTEAMRRLSAQAAECDQDLNYDMALRYAAQEGQIAAMHEAIKLGAKDVNHALAVASGAGQLEAMQELKGRGATDVNWALLNAAARGQLGAMRLARKWGATCLDASVNAAGERQPAAVDLLKILGSERSRKAQGTRRQREPGDAERIANRVRRYFFRSRSSAS